MIIIRMAQTWMRVSGIKSRRRPRFIEIAGFLKISGELEFTYRTPARRLLRRGRIRPEDLRLYYMLISCEHEPDASDCEKCKCPFHGTEGCDCRGGNEQCP